MVGGVFLEYDDIKNYLGSLVIGAFFLLAGVLLAFDETTSTDDMLIFVMNVILAGGLLLAGILAVIVGIYGILDVYKQEKRIRE